jgi:transcriptional regulator with XRE-family HTH domain
VSELERGTIVPTIGTLAKVAKALELTLADLVAIGDSPREKLLCEVRGLDDAQVDAMLRDVKKVRRGELRNEPRSRAPAGPELKRR